MPDETNKRVGINTDDNAPTETLDVWGTIRGTDNLKIDGTTDSYIQGRFGIGITSPGGRLHVKGPLSATEDNQILYGVRIDPTFIDDIFVNINHVGLVVENGRIGFGTDNPQNLLDVAGGVVIGSGYAGVESAPTDGLLVEGDIESHGMIKATNGFILETRNDDPINPDTGRIWLRDNL